MAISNVTTTNYVQDTEDLNAYKFQNPEKFADLEKKTPEKTPEQKSDNFNTANSTAVSTNTNNKQYIKSNLELEIKDKDGFTNMGKGDINAKVSGDVNITKDFIMDQLSKMKDSPEKKFYPPKFDADRKQFIISGKAINAVIGIIDVKFEIRLGAVNGNLAFQVDSGLTRGSIYSDLEKMMKDMGVETYRKDKLLYIKPTFNQTIDLPISKDKTHPAKIDKLETNADNTKVSIDKFGNVNVKLKDVQMTASTDESTTNTKLAKPDVADVKFDFSMGSDMKPNVNIKDGKVDANLTQEQVEKYAGKGSLDFVKENFGTSYSVSLSNLTGNVKIKDGGVDVNAKTHLDLDVKDSDSKINSDVNVSFDGKAPVIDAKNLKANLKGNQQVSAEGITYDGRKEGINIKAKNVDANVHMDGINAEVHGSGTVSKSGENLSADFTGTTKGDAKKTGLDATFETSGRHQVTVAKNKIEANIDLAIANANYDANVKPSKSNPTTKAPDIDINIKSVDVTGKVKTGVADVDASVKEGGIKVKVGEDVQINTDAKISGKATGETVNGTVEAQGANVKIAKDGAVSATANSVKADGSFDKQKNKLKVEGKVNGDVTVNIDKDSNVSVSQRNGDFDAKFNKGDKIKVDGKGKEADFKINNQGDISVDLSKVDAKTEVKANTVTVKAATKGEKVSVSTKGDDVMVKTQGTKSQADVKVKEIVQTTGTVGDVNLKVSSNNKGDDVKVDVKNADMKAHVKNKNGNLNVNVATKTDVNVHVKTDGNVDVTSKNAKATDVNFKLGQKIDVDAQGKNFSVGIVDDDVNIKLKDANFQGKVHPNQKINVTTNTATKSDINVKVSSPKDYDEIKVSTKSALQGHVNIDGKLDTDFSNKNGFNLNVRDDSEATTVTTNIEQINLKGNFDAGDAKLGIDGQGNFNLKLKDGDNISDVKVGYDGKLGGSANVGEMANGAYDVNGKVNVDINGDDINIDADGKIGADAKSDKFGVGAKASINGDKDNKIKVNINTKDKTTINASTTNGGLIELNDIDKLKLGKSDPVITDLLNRLKSKSAKIAYQNLDVQNNAQKVSVNVQAKDINTEYGSFSAGLLLKKNDNTVQIEKGLLVLQPNDKLFNFIKEEMNKKYKINITGTPELKDGVLNFKGEINSKSGITQIADFNIKTTIVDNKLVLDIDNAKVLKVVGANTLTNIADKVLNRTDIDHARVDKRTISIDMADIVKDLTLTEGINFTGIKLEGDKIKVGFDYNSVDQDIAKLAKNKDVKGLSDFIAKTGITNMSGEALSTAYSTFSNAKDIDRSAKLLTDLVRTYGTTQQNKPEIGRSLDWIAKNHGMKKNNINDDIVMKFAKSIDLKSAQGQSLIKALPADVVANLANNLDQTITQGGGLSIITSSERETANQMRRLKGLPENKSIF